MSAEDVGVGRRVFAEDGANFTDVFAIRSFSEAEIWMKEVSRIHLLGDLKGEPR
jgi:hypothetical protein